MYTDVALVSSVESADPSHDREPKVEHVSTDVALVLHIFIRIVSAIIGLIIMTLAVVELAVWNQQTRPMTGNPR